MAKESLAVRKTVKRRAKKKDSNHHAVINDQIISRVRELAWTGQHTQAIELATQALGMADHRSAIREMDLLDLRVESLSRPIKF